MKVAGRRTPSLLLARVEEEATHTAVAATPTPTPAPSPQGGGE
jgi:hypothetical protein